MKLDEYWYHLRCQDSDLPGKHLLRHGGPIAEVRQSGDAAVKSGHIRLFEGVSIYLGLKGQRKGDTFRRAAERACGYVIDVCGDKARGDYTKADANAVRDHLLQRKLAGSSIVRVLGTVRSVFNFAAAEEGLDLRNPFGKVYFDRTAGVKDRVPIPVDKISTVATACRKTDDELRWLIALIADTGMRLAEAAGLARDDFQQDDDGNFFLQVRPHPWRRLKTTGSTRQIPLEGSALWAANRIMANQTGSVFAFPKYNQGKTTNANSASATLNKWLRMYVPDGATMHGFRHAMRDRLRAVECPSDIVDQIGGSQSEGIGQTYGNGYPLSVLRKWMRAVCSDGTRLEK